MEQKAITNYSDLKHENAFPDAEKTDIISVLNKPIIIYDYKVLPSTIAEGKEFVVVYATIDGKKITCNAGEVIRKQLDAVKDKLPIRCSITKPKGKRYYTLN
jgi:hypothetical protein